MARVHMRPVGLALIVAVSLACPAHATIASSFSQTSVPFNASYKTGSDDLTMDNVFIRNPSEFDRVASQQHHVTYINETAVMITWASNQGVTFNGTNVPTNAANVTTALRLNMANNGVKVTPFGQTNYTYMFDNTPGTANAPGMARGWCITPFLKSTPTHRCHQLPQWLPPLCAVDRPKARRDVQL